MNNEQERMLRSWLAARDPGDAPARLEAVATQLPETGARAAFPTLGAALWRVRGLSASAKLVAILALLLAAVAAAGVGISRPWHPSPPSGLIAYVGPVGSTGTTGIRLVLGDGTGARAVSSGSGDVFDRSPRWSPDGRALAFARHSDLDASGPCTGSGSIVVYDVATATERVIATGLTPIDVVEWTPSGDRIAFLSPPPNCGAPGYLGFVDLDSGAVTTSRLGAGIWRLQRAGGAITAVDTTVWEVDARNGELVARCSTRDGAFAGHVEVLDRENGAEVDLGIGWAPTWSPDESAIAFIQVTDGSVDRTEHGAHLSVAGVDGWRVRDLAVITDPYFLRFGDVGHLPEPRWTSDGTAIYWLDAAGAHVVDVASRQVLDLTQVLDRASDLRWQPAPDAG